MILGIRLVSPAACGTYFLSNLKTNDGLSYNIVPYIMHSLQNVTVGARKAARFFYVGPA